MNWITTDGDPKWPTTIHLKNGASQRLTKTEFDELLTQMLTIRASAGKENHDNRGVQE